MKSRRISKFLSSPYTRIFSFIVLSLCFSGSVSTAQNFQNYSSEILVRRFSNSTGETLPKILKLTQNGSAEEREPSFTLKSDPVKVQSDFKTVDISILNRQKDKENAKKLAMVQEDLQSRIKFNKEESLPEKPADDIISFETTNPEEIIKKQARVKEDIESRLLHDDEFLSYQHESDKDNIYHYPIKRSDDDYYAEEPVSDPPFQPRMTTEAAKEEESFFSIFESLFGSSDDEAQSKKKAKPDDEPMFEEPEAVGLKNNIKTVAEIFKPLKPVEEIEHKMNPMNQNPSPEFRIVNNFHSTQTHKQSHKLPQPKPNYEDFYRPVTQRPFLHHQPYSTNGYEDYDLEEFIEKRNPTHSTNPTITSRVKYVSPLMTSSIHTETPSNPTSTTVIATAPSTTTSTKVIRENKIKFPSVQKKNDYFNRIKYQEIKTESTEKYREKETEKSTLKKTENKTSTENQQAIQSSHFLETNENEIKPQKIQESPNFYNLINLPVRYSTKDTAIPLISTSYANTKIQGTGAHKYEKKNSGKYSNHKYDYINTSTTKKPNYWGVKQVNTEKTVSTFKYTPVTFKTTTKYFSSSDLDKLENDEEKIGLGPAFGGYGNKKNVKTKYANEPTISSSTRTATDFSSTENNAKAEEISEKIYTIRPELINNKTVLKETSKKPFPNANAYEDYDYETAETQVVKLQGQSYPTSLIHDKEQENKHEHYQHHYHNSPLKAGSESIKQPEIEYEYYDYEVDTLPTTVAERTTPATATTAKIKFKYPELFKDKLKSSSSEKVAVVVPTQNFSLYTDNQFAENQRHSTTFISSVRTILDTNKNISASETTTVIPSEQKAHITTTPAAIKSTERETPQLTKKTTIHYPTSDLVYKEPAPVFENPDGLREHTIKPFSTVSVLKITSLNTTMKESTDKTVAVTAPTYIKDIENNMNVELIPSKKNNKKQEADEIHTQLQQTIPIQTAYFRPVGLLQSNHDFTTEFTVGAVQGLGNLPPKNTPGNEPQFVSSPISKNSYDNDEPFRPIPKPVGFSNIPLVHEDTQPETEKNSFSLQNKPTANENEPVHQPHEFIPSPQFHRPVESKSTEDSKRYDADYDFEGIQTEPKPGQFVIFSKPHLNSEMNANQVKQKEEVNSVKKIVSNIPYYHDKNVNNQKHVIFNPKEGQFYQSMPNLPNSDRLEQIRPIYGSNTDQLSLQLMPPRGLQTEKPFEGNFIMPDSEKKENTVSYPRPHWEKNGKPLLLMNTMSSKNDMIKHPPIPPHMASTLIPPSNFPPQRFRRPTQHHSPLRKNFNEATNNVKHKLNLPNILPQFRPNTKVNGGPYHRPSAYGNTNRRNGMNLYYDKEHGNFPYHIHHPDKDIAVNREYEMTSEIIPKFITNRGKIPSELWSSHGMQKRFGQSPVNTEYYTTEYSGENSKILRRLQRTPITTLQMLKQTPGIKTHKTQLSREDQSDPLAPLVPPIYKTFPDDSKKEENVYIVYPEKAPQKLQPDNKNVFVVSDPKSQKHFYNFTKNGEQYPLSILNSKVNTQNDKTPKVEFPYEFIKLRNRMQMIKNQQKDTKTVNTDTVEHEIDSQKYQVEPNFRSENDKIDMNLHMQSNNQWNEIRFIPEVNKYYNTNSRDDYFRTSKNSTESDKNELHLSRPIEFRTIKESENPAFTLGAVMHTTSEVKRKGVVSSVSLHQHDENKDIARLNVNEKISNGKIVTISMPVDVKEDSEEKPSPNKYNFLAPFQASSSIAINGSNQGWTIVKHPDGGPDVADSEGVTEPSTTQFSFENFKPEFIGGFKPLYEFPEETEKDKETTTHFTIKENVSTT